MTTSRQDGQPNGSAIDPITFEVIRHKLEAITEEQAITLKNVSGSPVVTEATDFNVGIYLADGAIVNMGAAGHLPCRHPVDRDLLDHREFQRESGNQRG